MTLVYLEGRTEQPHEAKFLAGLTVGVSLRNGRFWKGEVEDYCDLVYTNDEAIKAAYEAEGVDVEPIPTSVRPPSKKAPVKRKAAAKK